MALSFLAGSFWTPETDDDADADAASLKRSGTNSTAGTAGTHNDDQLQSDDHDDALPGQQAHAAGQQAMALRRLKLLSGTIQRGDGISSADTAEIVVVSKNAEKTPSGGEEGPAAEQAKEIMKPKVEEMPSKSPAAADPSSAGTKKKNNMKPNVWRAVVDKTTGNVYYYNRRTRETTWDKPKEGFMEIVGDDDDDDQKQQRPARASLARANVSKSDDDTDKDGLEEKDKDNGGSTRSSRPGSTNTSAGTKPAASAADVERNHQSDLGSGYDGAAAVVAGGPALESEDIEIELSVSDQSSRTSDIQVGSGRRKKIGRKKQSIILRSEAMKGSMKGTFAVKSTLAKAAIARGCAFTATKLTSVSKKSPESGKYGDGCGGLLGGGSTTRCRSDNEDRVGMYTCELDDEDVEVIDLNAFLRDGESEGEEVELGNEPNNDLLGHILDDEKEAAEEQEGQPSISDAARDGVGINAGDADAEGAGEDTGKQAESKDEISKNKAESELEDEEVEVDFEDGVVGIANNEALLNKDDHMNKDKGRGGNIKSPTLHKIPSICNSPSPDKASLANIEADDSTEVSLKNPPMLNKVPSISKSPSLDKASFVAAAADTVATESIANRTSSQPPQGNAVQVNPKQQQQQQQQQEEQLAAALRKLRVLSEQHNKSKEESADVQFTGRKDEISKDEVVCEAPSPNEASLANTEADKSIVGDNSNTREAEEAANNNDSTFPDPTCTTNTARDNASTNTKAAETGTASKQQEYSVQFGPGSLGLRLEPSFTSNEAAINGAADGRMGCRVVELTTTTTTTTNSQARDEAFDLIQAGDIVIAVDDADVSTWKYADIVHLLQLKQGAERLITFKKMDPTSRGDQVEVGGDYGTTTTKTKIDNGGKKARATATRGSPSMKGFVKTKSTKSRAAAVVKGYAATATKLKSIVVDENCSVDDAKDANRSNGGFNGDDTKDANRSNGGGTSEGANRAGMYTCELDDEDVEVIDLNVLRDRNDGGEGGRAELQGEEVELGNEPRDNLFGKHILLDDEKGQEKQNEMEAEEGTGTDATRIGGGVSAGDAEAEDTCRQVDSKDETEVVVNFEGIANKESIMNKDEDIDKDSDKEDTENKSSSEEDGSQQKHHFSLLAAAHTSIVKETEAAAMVKTVPVSTANTRTADNEMIYESMLPHEVAALRKLRMLMAERARQGGSGVAMSAVGAAPTSTESGNVAGTCSSTAGSCAASILASPASSEAPQGHAAQAKRKQQRVAAALRILRLRGLSEQHNISKGEGTAIVLNDDTEGMDEERSLSDTDGSTSRKVPAPLPDLSHLPLIKGKPVPTSAILQGYINDRDYILDRAVSGLIYKLENDLTCKMTGDDDATIEHDFDLGHFDAAAEGAYTTVKDVATCNACGTCNPCGILSDVVADELGTCHQKSLSVGDRLSKKFDRARTGCTTLPSDVESSFGTDNSFITDLASVDGAASLPSIDRARSTIPVGRRSHAAVDTSIEVDCDYKPDGVPTTACDLDADSIVNRSQSHFISKLYRKLTMDALEF